MMMQVTTLGGLDHLKEEIQKAHTALHQHKEAGAEKQEIAATQLLFDKLRVGLSALKLAIKFVTDGEGNETLEFRNAARAGVTTFLQITSFAAWMVAERYPSLISDS